MFDQLVAFHFCVLPYLHKLRVDDTDDADDGGFGWQLSHKQRQSILNHHNIIIYSLIKRDANSNITAFVFSFVLARLIK